MKVTTLAALLLAYCILVACTRTSPNAQLVQADSKGGETMRVKVRSV